MHDSVARMPVARHTGIFSTSLGGWNQDGFWPAVAAFMKRAHAGTATVAAIDRRVRVEILGRLVVASAESAVVGPSESGQGSGEPVDTGELSNPQVRFDGDEAPALVGSQMAESGD